MVREFSRAPAPKEMGGMPVELSGDLGIVGPPGHPRGANPRVSEALRAAVFKIGKSGEVLPELVEEDGKFHVVRLTGLTPPRERTYAEAERSIRVTLVHHGRRRGARQDQGRSGLERCPAERRLKWPK
jgi:hypothetical protein